MGPPVKRLLTIPLNDSAPLNKVAAMPIMVNFSRTEKALRLNLGIQHRGHSKKFVQTMILGLPLTFYDMVKRVLVAVAIREDVAWHLQISNKCFLSGE